MPFTASHPMAVLPVIGRFRLDTTCLVIGAMAPDFEYFMNGRLVGQFGHTLVGIAAWGVPVTLASALAFHAILKWPLVAIAPRWLARRVAGFAARPWPMRPIAWVASAAIGDVTHLMWDSVTHAGGWGERHFRWLDHYVTAPVLGPIPIFRVFQHVSTAVGLMVVAGVVVRALRRAELIDVEPASVGARALYAACVAGGIAAVVHRAVAGYTTDAGTLVVAPISGLLAGSLVACLALHRTGERARHRVMHPG